MFSLKSRWAWMVVALLIIILISSCTPASDASTRGIYAVDPTFADFYRQFGGDASLGPAISPSYDKDGVTYQYVVSGLMAYDPVKVPLERFHFSPIASIEWHVDGLVEPTPADGDAYYVNGHQVWEEIWSFYDQYGSTIIGLPVTGVIVNDAKQQYEQYFEGLGFYRNFDDPPGQIHLMPYGFWMCGAECQYPVSDSVAPSPFYVREFSATEQLFLQASERLGYGFTGAPLVPPRLGADGNYEMVFENVIMFIDPTDGNQIKLRPLPSWLGIQVEKPRPAIEADWLYFFTTQDGLGYNIPDVFGEYINQPWKHQLFRIPNLRISQPSRRGLFTMLTPTCVWNFIRLHPIG